MRDDGQVISKTEREFYQREKKTHYPSPDISKMQMVEIDEKTTLYIALDASADEARTRYSEYQRGKNRF